MQNVVYSAGECTTLLPGFEVRLGAQFYTDSTGCQ